MSDAPERIWVPATRDWPNARDCYVYRYRNAGSIAMIEYIRADLYTESVSLPAAVEGEWVMVPREPTKAMIEAWADAHPTPAEFAACSHEEAANEVCAKADWRAMLAAAPAKAED